MTAAAQPITIEQLARLYQARNAANKAMGQALRTRSHLAITAAKAEAGRLNRAYDAAKAAYKRQQKAARGANEEADRKEAAAETAEPNQNAA